MKRQVFAAIGLSILHGLAVANEASIDALTLSLEEAGSVQGLSGQQDALDINGYGQLGQAAFARAEITQPLGMQQ